MPEIPQTPEEKQNEEIAEKKRQVEIARIQHYHKTFGSESGQFVLDELKAFAGWKYPSYRVNQGWAGLFDTVFYDGRKEVVKLIDDTMEMQLPKEDDKPTKTEDADK